MSLLTNWINEKVRIFHKVLALPTTESAVGIYFVKNDTRRGVYLVSGKTGSKVVHKILDSYDWYTKSEVDSKVSTLQSEVDTLSEQLGLATSDLIYQNAVAMVGDLTTSYPTPSVGWASMVTGVGYIYVWNGTAWVNSGLKAFPEDVVTKENVTEYTSEILLNKYNQSMLSDGTASVSGIDSVITFETDGTCGIWFDYPEKKKLFAVGFTITGNTGDNIHALALEMNGGTQLESHEIINSIELTSDGETVKGLVAIKLNDINSATNAINIIISANSGCIVKDVEIVTTNSDLFSKLISAEYVALSGRSAESVSAQKIGNWNSEEIDNLSEKLADIYGNGVRKSLLTTFPSNDFPNKSLNPFPFVNGSPVDYEYIGNEWHIKMVGVAQEYLMPYVEKTYNSQKKKAFISLSYRIDNNLSSSNFAPGAYFMLWGLILYSDGSSSSFCMESINDLYTNRSGVLKNTFDVDSSKIVASVQYRIVFNSLQNITTGLGLYLSEPTLILTNDVAGFELFESSGLNYFSTQLSGFYHSVKSLLSKNSEKLLGSYPYLSGKKACFLGDSITVQNMWQPLLCELTGLKYDYTEIYPGKDGHSPSGLGSAKVRPVFGADGIINSNVTENKYGGSLHYRADSLQFYNADIIFIFGGTNDIPNLNCLGSETDIAYLGDEVDTRIVSENDQPTFYSSYKGILQKVTSQNKSARVICITPTRHWYYNNESGRIADNINKSIRDAIVYCAMEYGCEVIDLFGESGINNYNASLFFKSDNTDEQFQSGAYRVHPNDAGGNRIGSVISNRLK